MGRVVCVDYGIKRCGVAATDVLRIAAHSIDVIEKKQIVTFLLDYCEKEDVDEIVFGHPEMESGRISPMVQSMMDTIASFKKSLPDVPIIFHSEDYTSQRAAEILYKSGMPKMKRRKKGVLDKVSAVLILQDYLGHY